MLYLNGEHKEDYELGEEAKHFLPIDSLNTRETYHGVKIPSEYKPKLETVTIPLIYKIPEGMHIFSAISKISHDFYYESKAEVSLVGMSYSFTSYISCDIKIKSNHNRYIEFNLICDLVR